MFVTTNSVEINDDIWLDLKEAAEERFNELKEKQFDFLMEHERRKAQKLKVTVGDTEINLN